MLDQLIYTRCSPHRDLKNNGQVVRGDGFGVFSMSPELFDGKGLSILIFFRHVLQFKTEQRRHLLPVYLTLMNMQ